MSSSSWTRCNSSLDLIGNVDLLNRTSLHRACRHDRHRFETPFGQRAIERIEIGEKNGVRLPNYTASTWRRTIAGPGNGGKGTVGVSVFNAYNRQNVWYKEFTLVEGEVCGTRSIHDLTLNRFHDQVLTATRLRAGRGRTNALFMNGDAAPLARAHPSVISAALFHMGGPSMRAKSFAIGDLVPVGSSVRGREAVDRGGDGPRVLGVDRRCPDRDGGGRSACILATIAAWRMG